MQSFNPWVIFCSFCCVGPLIFGFVAFRLGISVGRRGMPQLQSPLTFRQHYASKQAENQKSVMQQVRDQQQRGRNA
jgi:hypothetical protein